MRDFQEVISTLEKGDHFRIDENAETCKQCRSYSVILRHSHELFLDLGLLSKYQRNANRF